jgi:hypothetical protein
MRRPWLPLLGCFFSTLPILLPTPALAQPAIPVEEFDPSLTKEIAKARFEADQATLDDLARSRRDAIATCFQIRYQLYRAGANEPGTGTPFTLNLVLESAAELMETELALSDKPADRLAIRANHWLSAWETERITTRQWRAAKVSTSALMQARSARLATEIKLLETLDAKERSSLFLILPVFLDGGENYSAEGVKEWARAQFEASQTRTRDLAKARRDALRGCSQERYELYRTGANEPGTGTAITLNLIWKSYAEFMEAETALSDKPDAKLAVRANQWFFAWLTQCLTEAQFQVGKVSRTTLGQARSARLTEEIKLLEMLPDEKRSEPFLIVALVLDYEKPNRNEAKEQAKSQFEASQARTVDLAKDRLDALEMERRIRWELYRLGANEPGTGTPITLNLLRESEARLLEAELALSKKPNDRLAAYEKNWEAKFLGEIITEGHFRVGRLSRVALNRSRYDRLDAEIRLREAELRLKDK